MEKLRYTSPSGNGIAEDLSNHKENVFCLLGGYPMKWLLIHLLLIVLGVIFFSLVLVLEIDGTLGFILATLGLFLIGLGLTLTNIIKIIMDIF